MLFYAFLFAFENWLLNSLTTKFEFFSLFFLWIHIYFWIKNQILRFLNQIFWYFSASQSKMDEFLLPRPTFVLESSKHMTEYSWLARNLSVFSQTHVFAKHMCSLIFSPLYPLYVKSSIVNLCEHLKIAKFNRFSQNSWTSRRAGIMKLTFLESGDCFT